MASPTVKFLRITDVGDGTLAHLNANLGPQGIWSGAGGTDPRAKFQTPTEAGVWAQPLPLVFQVDGNTVEQASLYLFDAVSNLEDMLDATPWSFKIKLRGAYVDPATITQAEIGNTWTALPTASPGLVLDNSLPNPTNDGNANLLVPHASVAGRWLSNFFIYFSFKPASDAIPGTHNAWSWCLTGRFPGM